MISCFLRILPNSCSTISYEEDGGRQNKYIIPEDGGLPIKLPD